MQTDFDQLEARPSRLSQWPEAGRRSGREDVAEVKEMAEEGGEAALEKGKEVWKDIKGAKPKTEATAESFCTTPCSWAILLAILLT